MAGIKSPLLTGLKQLTITYQTPQETLLATPEALPTTEPATSQIIYTVASGDLPSLNMTVESKVYVALIFGAGKNTDTVSRTVYYRMIKNGASVKTGSASVSAGYFYTFGSGFYNVAVGDVLELRLWAAATTVNWDYKAYQVQITRVALLEKWRVLDLYNLKSVAPQPALTLGTPNGTFNSLYVYHRSGSSISTTTKNFSPWAQSSIYKLWRIYLGDTSYLNAGLFRTSTTYRPYYYGNYVPTAIDLRAQREII